MKNRISLILALSLVAQPATAQSNSHNLADVYAKYWRQYKTVVAMDNKFSMSVVDGVVMSGHGDTVEINMESKKINIPTIKVGGADVRPDPAKIERVWLQWQIGTLNGLKNHARVYSYRDGECLMFTLSDRQSIQPMFVLIKKTIKKPMNAIRLHQICSSQYFNLQNGLPEIYNKDIVYQPDELKVQLKKHGETKNKPYMPPVQPKAIETEEHGDTTHHLPLKRKSAHKTTHSLHVVPTPTHGKKAKAKPKKRSHGKASHTPVIKKHYSKKKHNTHKPVHAKKSHKSVKKLPIFERKSYSNNKEIKLLQKQIDLQQKQIAFLKTQFHNVKPNKEYSILATIMANSDEIIALQDNIRQLYEKIATLKSGDITVGGAEHLRTSPATTNRVNKNTNAIVNNQKALAQHKQILQETLQQQADQKNEIKALKGNMVTLFKDMQMLQEEILANKHKLEQTDDEVKHVDHEVKKVEDEVKHVDHEMKKVEHDVVKVEHVVKKVDHEVKAVEHEVKHGAHSSGHANAHANAHATKHTPAPAHEKSAHGNAHDSEHANAHSEHAKAEHKTAHETAEHGENAHHETKNAEHDEPKATKFSKSETSEDMDDEMMTHVKSKFETISDNIKKFFGFGKKEDEVKEEQETSFDFELDQAQNSQSDDDGSETENDEHENADGGHAKSDTTHHAPANETQSHDNGHDAHDDNAHHGEKSIFEDTKKILTEQADKIEHAPAPKHAKPAHETAGHGEHANEHAPAPKHAKPAHEGKAEHGQTTHEAPAHH